MASAASKRTSRSSRQMLDVAGPDDISIMLKTLGISPSSTSKRTAPPSPATVVRRQTRSSTSSRDLQSLQETTPGPKSRTVSSGTTASTRSDRVSSSNGALLQQDDGAAPLTAIRRPAQQQAPSARTPSYGTETPLSTKENHHRAVSSSSHKQQDAPPPTRTKRSIPPPTASAPPTAQQHAPQHTDDEYSALLALLSAKEDEVTRLRTRLAASDSELREADQRATRLEKDKKELGQQIVSLNKQLVNDDTHSMRKQYEMQENLLQGFQRENEKATSEIDQLKKRERQLTEHLRKIYGPTFSLDNELSPGSSSDSTTSFSGMPSRRLSGLVGHPSLTSPIRGLTPPVTIPTTEEAASFDPAALMSQLESVQLLVQRFERRLLTRESELMRKEEEANEQVKRLDAIGVYVAAGGE